MTIEEFKRKFRPQMLLFITEAWAVRREKPSDLGMILDQQHGRADALMSAMFDVLKPKEKTDADPKPNGAPPGPAVRPASPGQAGPNTQRAQQGRSCVAQTCSGAGTSGGSIRRLGSSTG